MSQRTVLKSQKIPVTIKPEIDSNKWNSRSGERGSVLLPLERLRQHLARGEYVQARREAERLIHTGDLSGSELLEAYRGAAKAHFYVQDVFAAVKLGERVLELATSTENWEYIGKARFDLGTFYLTLGDTHLARQHLTQFLAELDRYPEAADLEARAHHNLGFIFRQRREYDQALASHQKAVALFHRDQNPRLKMEALRGVIWCHLYAGDPTGAWPYIEQVAAYLRDNHDEGLSASLLTDLACYHRLMGDIKRSMDFCEEALVPGRPGVDDHVLATACVIAGENALDVGRTHEAGMFANLALDYALKAKHPFLMNRASALRRRLYEINQACTSDT